MAGHQQAVVDPEADGLISGASQSASSQAGPETPNPPQQAKSVNARLAALLKKQDDLTSKLQDLEAELEARVNDESAALTSTSNVTLDSDPEQRRKQTIASAEAIVKNHIAALHSYNEIKDVGLGLMGLVAEQRGVRQIVVMDDFGVTAKD